MDANRTEICARAQCAICDQAGEEPLEQYCLCENRTHKSCAEDVLSRDTFCSQCGFSYRKRCAPLLEYLDFVMIFRMLWICLIVLLWLFDATYMYAVMLGSYFLLQETYKIYGKSVTESDDLSILFLLLGINNNMGLLLQHVISVVNDNASTLSIRFLTYCDSKLAPLTAKTIKLFGKTWYW